MPPKKRKADATSLDEMDRELYQRFRAAANSVSSLYTSSLNLQKRAFNGGARRTTENLLQWAQNHQARGEKNISASDLIQALQAELVVLEGEDSVLAASGDSPGGVAPWAPGDRTQGGGHGGRSRFSALDSNTEYEQELGAKLGQAFTLGTSPGPATRPRDGGNGNHPGPSPGNRMDDD